jgi:hypothetical protein
MIAAPPVVDKHKSNLSIVRRTIDIRLTSWIEVGSALKSSLLAGDQPPVVG